MGIIQRAKAIFSQTAFDQYVQSFLSGDDLPGHNGSMSRESALKYSAFWACCRVLAETYASVGINEYKKLPNGDREKTNDTGLYPILHSAPNDETNAYNFQECMMYQINLGGNFVAQRLIDGRKIVGLAQLDYSSYDIFRDKDDRKMKYRVRGSGESQVLDRSQVLHIPGPSINGLTGMSALQYGSSSIRLGSTYETFGQKFYENGALSSGVFELPGFVKKEAYERLKIDIKKNYTGLKNSGIPMLLEDGMKFNPLTIKPVDAELLSSKRFQIEDICRFMRVQPHLVQHLERSTNNNIEQQSLEFAMYTMMPHFKRGESAINNQLLTPMQRKEGYYFEYNMATLLRGDQKAMSEAFKNGILTGYYSVNDVRRVLNLNSVENGDTHLQPLNMVPLGTQPSDQASSIDSKIENKIKDAVSAAFDEASKAGGI